ncbi:CtsR family transcriptional regulator [Synergistaceae bacterium OttesenSCG-928-D05]|nr:CtsR family transcriptional regulator [Synergistaceae bacterium OttesenSCG-928-D05]
MSSSNLTKVIEQYIAQLLEDNEDGTISLRRKDLAERFGCVPSQINYVLRSRFAPEHGFLVESQRGGHGYIRVIQLSFKSCDEKVDHIAELIDNAITEQEARKLLVNLQNRKVLTPRERLVIEVALRNQEENGRTLFDISPYRRDLMRAELLRKLLTSLVLG